MVTSLALCWYSMNITRANFSTQGMLSRYFLSLLLSGCLLLTVLGIYLWDKIQEQQYRQQQKSLQVLENMVMQIDLDMATIRSDLRYLAGQKNLQQLKLADLAHDYLQFNQYKQRYDQVRFLDTTGMERLRVNFRAGTASLVHKEALQNKAHRYYFQAAFALDAHHIYVSRFDLNVEQKEIEIPFKPMLRFATPVFNQKGDKIGIVVLNYLGNYSLRPLRKLKKNLDGYAFLLNPKGYYLLADKREKEWGFMFPNSVASNFSHEYPQAWQYFQNHDMGVYENDKGIFNFSRPWRKPLSAPHLSDLHCEENCDWIVLVYYPHQRLWQWLWQHLHSLWLPMITALLTLMLGWWFLWQAILNKRLTEGKLEQLNQAISYERDVFMQGPNVVFRWRNELGWPVEYVSANVERVLGYRPEQFAEAVTYSTLIQPDYLQQFAQETADAIASEQTWINRSPYQVRKKNGDLVWLQDKSQVIRDANGRVSHFYGYINDISALKQVQKALERSEHFNQTVIDTLADPTLVIDAKTYQLILINRAAKALYLGEHPIHLRLTCYQLSHKQNISCTGLDDPCPLREVLRTRKPTRVLHRHMNTDGKELFIEISATPVFDQQGNISQVIETHRDISDSIKREHALQKLATTDSLTRSLNRRGIETALSTLIQNLTPEQKNLSALMFDIDYFKQINDTFGHNQGDLVLKQMVLCARACTRKTDLIGRWGGEEFLILLPDTELKAAYKIAELIRKTIENTHFSDIEGQSITASFGVGHYRLKENQNQFIERIDKALYAAKAQGRNCVK